MSAVSRSVPVFFLRIFAPRQNSWLMVPTTNAQRAKQINDAHWCRPSATSAPTVTTSAAVGHKNESRRLVSVDFRHASNGPSPVRNSRTRPIGSIHLLKNGGPTVSRVPVTASLSVGNIVAKATKNAQNSRIQLLTRKAASRETHESSSLARARSSG